MQKEYRTKCKDSIMEYLQAHKEHRFSAVDIHAYLESKGQQVNPTTIYRNLEKLMLSGQLMKYKTAEDESAMYQYVEPHGKCQEHLHMQCKSCGKITHLECGFMKEIRAHLLEGHGFLLECTGSTLTGLCEKCQSAKM